MAESFKLSHTGIELQNLKQSRQQLAHPNMHDHTALSCSLTIGQLQAEGNAPQKEHRTHGSVKEPNGSVPQTGHCSLACW